MMQNKHLCVVWINHPEQPGAWQKMAGTAWGSDKTTSFGWESQSEWAWGVHGKRVEERWDKYPMAASSTWRNENWTILTKAKGKTEVLWQGMRQRWEWLKSWGSGRQVEIKTKREKNRCLAQGNCPDLVILEHIDRGITFRHREGIRGLENFRSQMWDVGWQPKMAENKRSEGRAARKAAGNCN